jgi:spore germination protein
MYALSIRYPGKTFFEYNGLIVGKWFGALLSIAVIAYLCTVASFELRSMSEVTGIYLLEGTPQWAIMMVFVWTSLHLATGGLQSIARHFEIIMPITGVFFIISMLVSGRIFEADNLRPVLGEGIWPVIAGIKTTALTFIGVESILLLLAYVNEPKKGPKVVLLGTAVPLVFYLISVVMTIGAMSVQGVMMRTWPTLDLVRSFELPGLVVERLEMFLLVLWIVQMYSTFTITLYFAALGFSQLFGKPIKPFLYGLLSVIYYIAAQPGNIQAVFALGSRLGDVAVYLFGLLPALLLMLSAARGGGGSDVRKN